MRTMRTMRTPSIRLSFLPASLFGGLFLSLWMAAPANAQAPTPAPTSDAPPADDADGDAAGDAAEPAPTPAGPEAPVGRNDGPPTDDRFVNAPADASHARVDDWWTRFGDARLDDLVETGLRQNYDLASADARIEESQAVVKQNLAPLLPTLSWDSTITMAPTDSLGFQFGGSVGGQVDPMTGMPIEVPNLYWTGSSALKAGLAIDLSGRDVVAYKAAKRDVEAAELDRESTSLRLVGSIVGAYYDVVAAEEQLRIVEKQLETSRGLLEVMELRFAAGQVTGVDVLQQRQQVASTEVLLPQARRQVATFEQQLAVLMGERPRADFEVAPALPDLPSTPGLGTPSDLAQHRPDLVALRARKDSAEYRVKNAKRQYVPTLNLQAQAGVQAIRITELNSQWYWNAGATLSVPLYQGGRRHSTIRQRQAQSRQAEVQLDSSSLTAVREVEDALVYEREQGEALAIYQRQVEAADAAFEAAKQRCLDGDGDYLTVLNALNTQRQAELNVVTARRDLIGARINLHQALGDGAATAAAASRQG